VRSARPVARQRSREAALQVLYALDLSARGQVAPPAEGAVRDAFEAVAAHFELPEGARVFAEELVRGVCARLPDLDQRLALHAHRWRLERMAAVDRNILRLAAHELLVGDIPPAVAIDQAVELARRFGSERSPAFVNGVLDGLARELAGGCAREEGAR